MPSDPILGDASSRIWHWQGVAMARSGHERWLEAEGEAIRAWRGGAGASAGALSPTRRLIEILWLVSRSMRLSGDLAAARRRDPSFLESARRIAVDLHLPHAMAAFCGSEAALERQFFELFEDLCREIEALQARL